MNRPTASSANQLQTSASSFGRLELCARAILAAEYFARVGERSTIALEAELARWTPKGERLLIAMRKEVMGMMKPTTKKILLGAPAVALSAALACTMVACGGGGGEQGESGGDAAASKSAYESQKIEVEGFTVESLADGTYYRGEFYGQDGFWLRVRITNTSDKPLDRFSFTTNAAPGNLEPGDSIFNTFTAYAEEIETPPAELCKDAQTEGNPTIAPGEALNGCISGLLTTTITGLLPSNSRMTYRAEPTPA